MYTHHLDIDNKEAGSDPNTSGVLTKKFDKSLRDSSSRNDMNQPSTNSNEYDNSARGECYPSQTSDKSGESGEKSRESIEKPSQEKEESKSEDSDIEESKSHTTGMVLVLSFRAEKR